MMINYLSDTLSAGLLILSGYALLIASSCVGFGATLFLAGVIKLTLTTWDLTFVDLARLPYIVRTRSYS